jgi:hypothetical protein
MTTTPGQVGEAGETVRSEHWDRANEIVDVVEKWKARIDGIRVQLDLAKLELRDQATRQLELATNANAAAGPKLREAYRDAAATAEALRDGVEQLLEDVKGAMAAVQDVLEKT